MKWWAIRHLKFYKFELALIYNIAWILKTVHGYWIYDLCEPLQSVSLNMRKKIFCSTQELTHTLYEVS